MHISTGTMLLNPQCNHGIGYSLLDYSAEMLFILLLGVCVIVGLEVVRNRATKPAQTEKP